MQESPQQYTQRILSYTDGKEPLRVQQATAKKLAALTKGLTKKQFTQKPEQGKWSIAEILAHLADAEVVASWRLRLILGQNGAPVKAYDQDAWAQTFNYAGRDPKTSLAVFCTLRESNLALLKSVPKALWENYGMHEERGKETIAHIVRMFAGHDLNHLGQVERIAKAQRRR
jgi:uncharacterized damage-inducible protein DinB